MGFFFAIGSGFGCSPLFFGLGKKVGSEWLVRRGIGGGGFVLLSRRTFLARLVLEFSSPSPPVGASALRLMDDESAIVVVFVVVVVVLLELPASGQNLWPN